MKYKVLEGIATADVAYEVYGKTLEELFANAAETVEQTMVDITTVRPLLSSKFKVQSSKLDELLINFLNELIFYKDAKQMLFSHFEVEINQQDARLYYLNAQLRGEKIDPINHKLRTDVKAVTRHHLEVKKEKDKYLARIVLDI